jgi:hypothetical protein
VRRIAFVAMAGALALGPSQAQGTTIDFSNSPVTTGSWTYRAVTGGSEASFVDGSGQARMVIACGRVTRLVTLSRISAAPASSISIWTSSASRDLPSRFDQPSGRVIAQLGGADFLLDAIAHSRGRFAVLMPGAPALVLPAGTEVAHVVEDCRA